MLEGLYFLSMCVTLQKKAGPEGPALHFIIC